MARINLEPDKKVVGKPGRIPFDADLWQANDAGDFINMKTGEERSGDDFLNESDADGGDGQSDWGHTLVTGGDESQDATGDDFIGAQVKMANKKR